MYQEVVYKLKIKISAISGKGLYADEFIPKRHRIIEYTGEKIPNRIADKREIQNDKTGHTYIMILNRLYCLDGARGGNDSIYANHSCDPNAYLVHRNGKVFIYAKKNIRPGDELTYDYSFADPDDPDDRVPCRCGSKNCRGFINEMKRK